MDSLLYSYVVGGIFFAIGLIFAAKNGYIGMHPRGVRNLLLCFGVLAVFLGAQLWLQYGRMETLPAGTYTGGAEHVVKAGRTVRGTTLDYLIVLAYFAVILWAGTWFARNQKTTKDFFFGGQRFSWWLIAMSLIASLIGSYSFVKYSQIGYSYGLSSSQAYLNDWIWFPLLVFGWLPILYFSRITSIPEYFGRRFNPHVRNWATVYLIIYLVGYIGVNLFTMGKIVNVLLGWPIPLSALIIALVTTTYVTAGGQTSVIMTDLIQGALLLVVGLVILYLGVSHLGGIEAFWGHLPRDARLAFHNFNADPEFPAVGIFWQDAIAGSAMFYFLNQGIAMRMMAAKSLSESRKSASVTILVLMVLAAVVVASGGWVARALVHAGALPGDIKPDEAFFIATEFLSRPGIFGLVLAALTAALMSTVDTLITAVAAVTVNDIYKPYIRPNATEAQLLASARVTSVLASLIGIGLVPVFMSFNSVYAAHAAFTAAVTPPMVVALLFAVFWRRFTAKAALWTLVGGMAAIVVSMAFPDLITPFAHGVPAGKGGSGLLDGMRQHQFMRACYGMVVCATIGIGVTLLTRSEPMEKQRGLVWGTIGDALRQYTGSAGEERFGSRAPAMPVNSGAQPNYVGAGKLPAVAVSRSLAAKLNAAVGDLLYVTDRRAWTGGLNSAQVVVSALTDSEDEEIVLDQTTFKQVVAARRTNKTVVVECLYSQIHATSPASPQSS